MLTYSTHGMPASAKVGYWSDVASDAFAPVEIRPTNPAQFDAELRCAQFGRLRLASVRSGAVKVQRTRRASAKVEDQRYLLHVQLNGRLMIAQEGREALLEQGDLLLTDNSLPYTLMHDDDCATLVQIVTPDEIRKHLPTPEEVTCVKLSGDKGLSRTTSLMLRSVWEQAEEGIPPELGSRIADSLLDVFATSWIADKGVTVAETAIVGARRVQIKRHIEANLRNPDLNVRSVAAAFNISPRYLHVLFANEPETVSSYILRRRLEECGRQLTDVLWRRRTITEIAFGWGFNNATHFARVFRNHYGTSPRDYRNARAAEVVASEWPSRVGSA
jgi:AraC-like DNA-binding protein